MGKFLKNIWDNVVGEGGYEFIKTWGFPLMTPILLTVWGWIRDIPGPYLAQMFLATFAIALFISREWREKHAQPLPPLLSPNERLSTTDTWLTEIAGRDLISETGVVLLQKGVRLRTAENATAYLEFSWTLFNGLVWEIEIEERPTGHISLAHRPLSEIPDHPLEPRYSNIQFHTLYTPYQFPYRIRGAKRIIAHGEYTSIHFHHWLSQADVTILRKHASSDGYRIVAFRDFNIWTIRGLKENKQRIRLNLQSEEFHMPELVKREKDKP